MKTLSTMTAAIALLVGAGAAHAADVYSHGGLKDGAPTNVAYNPIYGFYVEVNGGLAFARNDLAGVITLSETGGVVVGRAGYDFLIPGNRFGFGLWGEVGDGLDLNGKFGSATFSENVSYGGGGKVFYDHGGGQIYAILGYAGTDVKIAGISKTLDGLEWGGGINLKLAGNWYGKLEFDQVRYSDASLGFGTKWSQIDDRALIGIGYSFGGWNGGGLK